MSLDQLLDQRPDLWRGRGLSTTLPAGVPTGFAALDEALPWRGWPPHSLSEVLTAQPGVGLGLLLPMLIRLSRREVQESRRWLLLVDPPFIPYAPALAAQGLELEQFLVVQGGADGFWAMEQGLRSGDCAVVVGWASGINRDGRAGGAGPRAQGSPRPGPERRRRGSGADRPSVLRRLQLAADAGDTPMVLLREIAAAERPSPAALRIVAATLPEGLELRLLKLRGARAGARLVLRAADQDESDRVSQGGWASAPASAAADPR